MAARWLRRNEAVTFLNDHGYPITRSWLEKLALVGGGPAFTKFGRFPLYAPTDLLAWAEARCSEKVTSTSQLPIKAA